MVNNGLKAHMNLITSPISEKVKTIENFILGSNKEQGINLEDVIRSVSNKYREELKMKLRRSPPNAEEKTIVSHNKNMIVLE
jgi:hypothetical protein